MAHRRAKINSLDQVCPWEETFMNLVQRFQNRDVGIVDRNFERETPHPRSVTIEPPKPRRQVQHSHLKKRSMHVLKRRSFLTMSKINFNKAVEEEEESPPMKMDARPFEGPRLTFYSKMNPRSSRYHLNGGRQCYNERGGGQSDRLTGQRILRDESIKYLQIDEGHRAKAGSSLNTSHNPILQTIYPLNHQYRSIAYQRKKQDKHETMKRLAIIRNNTKRLF